MEHQGYNDRMDEHLAMRRHQRYGRSHRDYKQSMTSRRRESEGMEKSHGKRKYSGDKMMDRNM